MIVAMAATMLALSSASATKIGPIFAGESVAAMRRSLGPGTSSCLADPGTKPPDCTHVLEYRDGKNVLKITLDLDYVAVIEVDLAVAQGKIARAHVSPGAFATWKWNGHRIDRMPTASIAGWTGPVVSQHKNCYVQLTGPAQPSGAELRATFACADGTSRIGTFSTSLVDP